MKAYFVHLLLVPIIGIGIYAGVRGVDFGPHVDEPHIMNAIHEAVNTGLLMKRWYNYPDIAFDIALLSLAPEVFSYMRTRPDDLTERMKAMIIFKSFLLDFSKSEYFHLRVRSVFVVVSYLALLWIYLLVLKWRGNWLEALLASALVGLSWEVNYHSRWIACDALMMQFASLEMLALAGVVRSRNKLKWLRFAAIAAGLATGTKYNCFLLILPVMTAALLYFRDSMKRVFLTMLDMLFCFLVTYYITTPGTLLDPIKFMEEAFGAARHYSSGVTAQAYQVGAGLPHVWKVLVYLALVLFSKYSGIALIFFLFSLFGIYAMIREEKKAAIIFLVFPISFILFMGSQRILFIRNYLAVAPFLAVFAARGISFLGAGFMKRRFFGGVFILAIAGLLTVNVVWLVRASDTIKNKNQINKVEELANYLEGHQNKAFFLTERVAKDLQLFSGKTFSNVVRQMSDDVAGVVFYFSEEDNELLWTPNRFHYGIRWIGPQFVNYDYYPTWRNVERIVIMSPDNAKHLAIVK